MSCSLIQNRNAFAAVMLILSGCGQGHEIYEVDGVDGKFCVPDANVVPRVAWLPPDRPGTPKTFAFQGCWSANPTAQTACAFPSVLRGGVVSPKSSFRRERWQDIAADSFYKKVVLEHDSLLEVADTGSTLIVSNRRLWKDWYIWRKAKPLTVSEPHLDDDDELVAVCHTVKNVTLPEKQETRDMISCDRYVQGKDYTLNYSFESSGRVPRKLEALDVQIFKQIDRWRCEK
jgi:hypothetical protein